MCESVHPLAPGGRIRGPVAVECAALQAQHLRHRVGCGRRAHTSTLPREAAQRQMSPVSRRDRKSTRLNSSHVAISYAVFCLKKKKKGKDRYMQEDRKLNHDFQPEYKKSKGESRR